MIDRRVARCQVYLKISGRQTQKAKESIKVPPKTKGRYAVEKTSDKPYNKGPTFRVSACYYSVILESIH
jgi:hypothetical protein